MIKQQKLEELIREKVLLGAPDVRGFHSLKCQCCNDYKIRAGFKFDNNQVGYNCWNCGTTAMYEEFGGNISKKMRAVLHAYGIDDSEIGLVVNSAFFTKKEGPATLSLASLKKVNTHTPTISLPEQSFKLGATTEHLNIQEKIAAYLYQRSIDMDKYPFFFSTLSRFKDRVIIPFYRNGNLVYWQARTISPFETKRYDNCQVARDAIIYNSDQLNSFNPSPLFVSEGVFDAMMFDGIAVLGSKLTDAKLELLNNTNRRLVFVIDKDKNGASLAENVLRAGWEITFAPDGAEDLNKSVVRFGRSYTAQQLIQNIPRSAGEAELAIKVRCR